MEKELPIQTMCFNRGSIVAQLRTDRRGYCPGEAIALTGGFCNNTSLRTKPITVSLYQKTVYTQGTVYNNLKKRQTWRVICILQVGGRFLMLYILCT